MKMKRVEIIYPVFKDWCDAQELIFPCTVEQFAHRAIGFAQAVYAPLFTQRIVDLLCKEGIGKDWREKLFNWDLEPGFACI